jgi:ABC-type protease/lipase transport system fused ATPase/permease subunit
VLDEPNSNLDSDGDIALSAAIESVRRRGGVVIVVAHRPSALASLDQLLVMTAGAVQTFGPKDEVLAKVTRPAAQVASGEGRTMTVVPLHPDRR